MEIFIDLQLGSVLFLLFVGFVGGLVSGFIGAGGAFVFTPAMMAMGIPAIVAVASNLCYLFPKALVGGLKRAKYGQVDVKLAIVMGLSAAVGVFFGAIIQTQIKQALGNTGSNLYVSIVFVVVLAIVGGYALKSAWKIYNSFRSEQQSLNKLAHWVHSIRIPGTMMYFRSLDAKVSILFVFPLGFFVGLLAGSIAVSGFIGVTVTMFVLGVPGLMASATELMIAFFMGITGTIIYALDGFVDIRLAMIILAGSLFGVQLGVVSTTYAKDYMVKMVMGLVMILIMLSLSLKIPTYLFDLGYIKSPNESVMVLFEEISFIILILALAIGAAIILYTFISGSRRYAKEQALAEDERAIAPIFNEPDYFPTSAKQLSPTGRFEKIMIVTDNSEHSAAATREGIRLAQRTEGSLSVMSIIITNSEHESLAKQLIEKENNDAITRLETLKSTANDAGVECEIKLRRGIEIYQEIVDESEEIQADVIVMGRRDYTGFMRALMRSNTSKVIGYARCSVLVVPRMATLVGQKMLLAIDGSRYSDTAASTAMSLAKHLHASVFVVSIASTAHQEKRHRQTVAAIERVENFLSQEGISVEGRVLSGNPAEAILEVAKAKGIDLIVMGSHGHTGLNKILLGSVSDRVIASAECATLVVKAA